MSISLLAELSYNNNDGSSLQADSQPKSPSRLAWSEVTVAWCLVCIHRMNRVNSRNGLVTMTALIGIIIIIIINYFCIIIIIIIITCI